MRGDERQRAGVAQRRVLVVDDDASIQGFLAEALAVLRVWRPDLILLDLMMPEMDGWAFRAEQRALPDAEAVAVIVLSATRELAAKTEGLAAAAVFAKPFDLDRLLSTIDRLTDRQP